ncbi:MAG TPA: 30S ribosomal protein S18, partial [Pseudonocardiaceae bacterium]|nr:30S ribosomal protein S18 [Pseudonocardiaceae bacterium]
MADNRQRRPVRRKRNPLLTAGVTTVDWKNVALLRTFISDRGKIRARRVTGLTPRQQREVA